MYHCVHNIHCRGGCGYVGTGSIWELCTCIQFSCEPKMSLKIVYLKKFIGLVWIGVIDGKWRGYGDYQKVILKI